MESLSATLDTTLNLKDEESKNEVDEFKASLLGVKKKAKPKKPQSMDEPMKGEYLEQAKSSSTIGMPISDDSNFFGAPSLSTADEVIRDARYAKV